MRQPVVASSNWSALLAEEPPAGAKAHGLFVAFSARLKSCPVTKRSQIHGSSTFSASCKDVPCYKALIVGSITKAARMGRPLFVKGLVNMLLRRKARLLHAMLVAGD